jgi:hypothetical protein
MMANPFKGWLKIYLFYGAAFFLLGLLGYLASDQITLTSWSTRQIQKISQVWSFITYREDNAQTVPAFTSQPAKIVLQVYRAQVLNGKFEELLVKLRGELQKRFKQVVIIPVVDLNIHNSEIVNPNATLMLIGYKQVFNPQQAGSVTQSSLYFSMPEPASYMLCGKFIQAMTGIVPTFNFNKQDYGRNAIYELSWDTTGNTQNLDQEVFSTFIQAMDKNVIQALKWSNLK